MKPRVTTSNTNSDSDLAAHLFTLERQFMDLIFRKDRERVAELLAEEFCEFGSSGRVWTRDAILDLLAGESPQVAPKVEDFATQEIAPQAMLVTYRAVRKEESGAQQSSLRNSIWIRRDDRWQILFHQGTKVPMA